MIHLPNNVRLPGSLPLWERGLKFRLCLIDVLIAMMSLPLWERGLKFAYHWLFDVFGLVAPFVGAWIEIIERSYAGNRPDVAPFAGAWIEMGSPVHSGSLLRRSLHGSVD